MLENNCRALCRCNYGLRYKPRFSRLSDMKQGFGPNSLRAIGIVIFIPVLLMLALLAEFQSETLAALLGAVAGYVLSNSKPED